MPDVVTSLIYLGIAIASKALLWFASQWVIYRRSKRHVNSQFKLLQSGTSRGSGLPKVVVTGGCGFLGRYVTSPKQLWSTSGCAWRACCSGSPSD